MIQTKLLMQRLAYASWLLAAGLALGWAGGAAAQTLTARFAAMPEWHDGSEFAFELHFSEEIEMSFVNLRDEVLEVTGGTVQSARRLTASSNLGWEIAIEPDSEVDVSISLPPTADCTAVSAVCTADGRALSSELAVLVPGLPLAPTNVVATLVNGVLSVTWEQTGTNQEQNTYRVRYREEGTAHWEGDPSAQDDYAALVADVRSWYITNRDVNQDVDAAERWLRVLIALGAETHETLELMTSAEAREWASNLEQQQAKDRFARVADALSALERLHALQDEYADLIDMVRDYYDINKDGPGQGENWLRVLIAFGVESSDILTPYTVAEAEESLKIWSGWQPVLDALKEFQALTQDDNQEDADNNAITYAEGAGTTVPYEADGLNSDAIYEVQVRSAKSKLVSEWVPEPPASTVAAEAETTMSADEELESSTQQAVQADLVLSVNPASVREDAGETDVEVTVEVADGTALTTDTYVLLDVSHEGLNSRFYIRLTLLRIPAGEKSATATITLIPINDDVVDENLSIEIRGNAGLKTVESATIVLVDDDKESKNINLSADITELNRFDGATEITVTATLDGKVLNETTSFVLTIGDHPNLTDDPNADTDGDGNIDDADATRDNREAQRDLDYTARLARLTIPRNSVSGTATITITPQSRLPGTIRVASPDFDADADAPGIQIEDDGLTLSPVDIKIKKEVIATADAITLSQERIREDASETTVELKVALTEALVEDATVSLAVLSDGAILPSGEAVKETPLRDVHYTLAFGPTLTIPAGATEGMTTFTITPMNDTDVVQRGAIYIQVTVGDLSATKTIVLVDDDAKSMNIALTAEPATISEGAGATEIVVTGTLDGKVFDNNVVLILTIDEDINGEVNDADEAATRDIDYSAAMRRLTIPAGLVSGTTTITITPFDDQRAEADEIIRVAVPYPNNQITVRYDDGDNIPLTISPADIILQDTGEGGVPSFAADIAIDAQPYVVGRAIADWVLPEASGGDGELTYSVSSLPAGLEFDAATRTLGGTPTEATDGAVTVIYIATDSGNDTATLTFAITVAGEGTVPVFAEDASINAQTYTVGAAIVDWVLPEASGGDGELTYSVSSLPAGLEFDAATRTLGGTPTEATDGAVTVAYTATDDNSATTTLTFTIAVNPAPSVAAVGLAAVPAVIREDAAATEVSLTFSLEAAAAVDESVRFAIVAPSEGTAAVRDVDYTATLEVFITIPAGATEGMTTLTLTPIDDDEEEGLKALGVRATLLSTGEALSTDIEIRDDETPSTSIALSAEPRTLTESDPLTTVTITATLDGKALAEDATVHLAIDNESTATRDLDYAALFTPMIEIPAGSTTGTVGFYVDPVADNLEEGDEIIRLVGTIDELEGSEVEIAISDPGAAAKAAMQTRPKAFSLADNFPNPFNPATTIQYALPTAADVELTVYNVLGQPVRTLVAEHQSAGHYAVEWDATNDSGQSLSSGLYFYRLQAGGKFREIKKMLLLR